MVSYMYVTMVTTEFKYSSTIMIMTSSLMTSYQYNNTVKQKSFSKWLALHCTPQCSSVIVTFIVHYIMMTSHCSFIASESAALNSIRSLQNYFHWYFEIRGVITVCENGLVKRRIISSDNKILIVHSLSHLVSMVSYMYRCDHLALLTEQ